MSAPVGAASRPRGSLRRLLMGMTGLLVAVTMVSLLAVALRILPIAFDNAEYSRRVRLLLAVTGARSRLVSETVNRLEPLVRTRLVRAATPAQAVNEVVDGLQATLDSTALLQSTATAGALPSEVRFELARSADLDARFSAMLQGLRASLDLGEAATARQHLSTLERLAPEMVANLSRMEQLAFDGLIARDAVLAERASEVVRTVGGSLLLSGVLFTVVAIVLQWRLFAPLAALDRALAQVSAGNLTTRLPSAVDDELGRLGQQFNRMLATLAERQQRDQRAAGRLTQLLDSAHDEIYLLDPATFAVRSASRRAQFNLGFSAEEFGARTYPDLVPGLTPELLRERLEVLRSGKQLQFAAASAHRRKDGSSYPVEVTLELFAEDDPPALVVVARDVSERVEADVQLRESEGRFRTAFAEAPVGMLLLDLTRGIQQVNTRFVSLVGIPAEELAGQPLESLAPPDAAGALRERLDRVLSGGSDGMTSFEEALRGPGGTLLTVRIHATLQRDDEGRPLRGIVHVEDVSAERLLERQFRQSQRIEAVGQLAGGIAHDFNNLLTAIVAYADGLRTSFPPGDPRAGEAVEILTAADRAATLVQQLLGFARRQRTAPRVVTLPPLLHRLEPMLSRLLGADLEVTVEAPPNPWCLEIDPSLLEQVVVNLAINARDAMPGGGRLILQVENLVVREPQPDAPEVPPGAYVRLNVRDTGVGIGPEVLAHIFEPFFTTKPVGAGSGLGLAMCYGVVKQAGGYVYAESAPGKGSTFRLLFPRSPRPPDMQLPAPAPEAEFPRGNETILLVEDEPQVRAAARRTLEPLGYRVLAAATGTEGRHLGLEHLRELDLIVTDVILPGLVGPELVRKLQAVRPDLPVLYTSGHGFNHLAHGGRLGVDVDFLPKPYTPRELADRVRAALDRRPPVLLKD